MSIQVSLTDPDAGDLTRGDARWLLSSIVDVPDRAVDRALAVRMVRDHPGGSFIALVDGEAGATTVFLGRGLLSSHERFFHLDLPEQLVISDHFRNVVATVAPARRVTAESSVVEHMLFRQLNGASTYVEGVDRITRGELIEIGLASGSVSRLVVDRIEASPNMPPPEDEVIDRLDAAFGTATAISADMENPCLLFSGGVDSTLLLTYVDAVAAAVTIVPDTPEFAPETSYARTAARLRGIELEEIPVAEREFVAHFERSTRLLGLPPTHDITPMFEPAFDTPHDTVFVGEGADAVFGLNVRLNRVAGWFANPVGVPLLEAIDKIAPSRLKYRSGQLAESARRLKLPPGPRSWAVGNSGGPKADQMIEAFGAEAVLSVLEHRLAFVEERVALEATGRGAMAANTELRHWMFTLADPLVMERHQAQARGKRLMAPYADPEVMATALLLPAGRRWAKGLRGKWLLKHLLSRRLPGYPVNQRKKHTALPFERFAETGPLHDFWDRYAIPDEFQSGGRETIAKAPGLDWPAMTLAMWRTHIAENRDLQPHPAKVNVEVGD